MLQCGLGYEYVWGSAWCFFKEGDPAAEQWVHDKATAILEGKAGIVAAAIRRKATRLGLDNDQRLVRQRHDVQPRNWRLEPGEKPSRPLDGCDHLPADASAAAGKTPGGEGGHFRSREKEANSGCGLPMFRAVRVLQDLDGGCC